MDRLSDLDWLDEIREQGHAREAALWPMMRNGLNDLN